MSKTCDLLACFDLLYATRDENNPLYLCKYENIFYERLRWVEMFLKSPWLNGSRDATVMTSVLIKVHPAKSNHTYFSSKSKSYKLHVWTPKKIRTRRWMWGRQKRWPRRLDDKNFGIQWCTNSQNFRFLFLFRCTWRHRPRHKQRQIPVDRPPARESERMSNVKEESRARTKHSWWNTCASHIGIRCPNEVHCFIYILLFPCIAWLSWSMTVRVYG